MFEYGILGLTTIGREATLTQIVTLYEDVG